MDASNHELEQLTKVSWKCKVCLVVWYDLTERDILMLSEKGQCIGEVETWRPCSRVESRWCLGHQGECIS